MVDKLSPTHIKCVLQSSLPYNINVCKAYILSLHLYTSKAIAEALDRVGLSAIVELQEESESGHEHRQLCI